MIPIFSEKQQKLSYLFVVLLPFLIYFNAIDNEYGMDDYYVTEGNPKTADGIENIPALFANYYADDGETRFEYRPITHTTFAIEKSLFGALPDSQLPQEKSANNVLTEANVSHFINILLYALNGLLLLYFLNILLKDFSFGLPLIITVLFLVHPIHTEVVNNIKSRDELLMMVFLLLGLVQCMRYGSDGLKKRLPIIGGLALIAFLSKMSSLAFFGLIPVCLYYAKAPVKRIFIALGTVVVALAIVLLLRDAIPGEEFRTFLYFENPLFVDDGIIARISLGFYSAFVYLQLLIFPKDLSFYYGHSQIPIVDFSFWQVWVSMLIFIPLGIYGLKRLWKRDVLGLALVLWLGVMAIVVNVVYPMVGIVSERFGYIFSVGFVMVVGILLWRGYAFAKARFSAQKATLLLVGCLVFIGAVYSWRTLDRNEDWENRLVLYRHDIKHLQNSFRAHTFLADDLFAALPQMVKQKNGTDYIKEVQALYTRALEIDPKQSNAWNNLGAIQYKYYNDYEAAAGFFEKAKAIDGDNTDMLLNTAYSFAKMNQYSKAVNALKEALMVDPQLRPAYIYLLSLVKHPAAHAALKEGFSEMATANPAIPKQTQYWLTVAQFYATINRSTVAVDSFAKAFLLDTTDAQLGQEVVRMYAQLGDTQKEAYFKQVLVQ
ncbi:MAG: tetratricopeptide (TPR) repeat protein [Flavobacteriales bacterium]|jgi:tetratricopeptide (TPR) repeat protein